LFPLPEAVNVASFEEWLFQLVIQLHAGDAGNWARADVQVGTNATNWVHFLRMTIQVLGEESFSSGGPGDPCFQDTSER